VIPDKDARARLWQARMQAPTLLESMLWGWLLGLVSFDSYRAEAEITDLRGPGYLPSDEQGEPDAD